jgi:hypothetical protein
VAGRLHSARSYVYMLGCVFQLRRVTTNNRTCAVHRKKRRDAMCCVEKPQDVPAQPEWEDGKCPTCGEKTKIHTGFGECEACIFDTRRAPQP